MVADADKMGNQDDEYLSEVTSEEHIEGEQLSQYNDPLADVEMEDAGVAPKKTSALRKVGIAIVIVIVALIVSMYLSHKQKMKEAAESGKTTLTKITTPAAAENQIPVLPKPSADKPAENKASVATEKLVAVPPAPAAPVANNAALAAAISKSVSAEPAKTETQIPAVMPSTPSTSAAENTPAAPEKTAAVASEVSTAVEASPAPIAAATDVELPKIKGRIDDLALQTQANQTKISDLSTRLDSIDKSLTDMNKTMGSLEKKMNLPVVVAQQNVAKVVKEPVVSAMPEKIIAVKKIKAVKRNPEHRSRAMNRAPMNIQQPAPIPYVLRAVIPGRAWIERPFGGVLTIVEGEYVPGMGKVIRIDDDNGEVTLDSGNVIKYGPDDH